MPIAADTVFKPHNCLGVYCRLLQASSFPQEVIAGILQKWNLMILQESCDKYYSKLFPRSVHIRKWEDICTSLCGDVDNMDIEKSRMNV